MTLKDYIQSKRHGKEANQLEREAMNDPFLQDAIEGFDSVQGNHLDIIEQLERRVERKSDRKTLFIRYSVLSIAATVALILGISLLFRQQEAITPVADVITVGADSDSIKTRTSIPAIASNETKLKKSEEKSIKGNDKQVYSINNEVDEEMSVEMNDADGSTVVVEELDEMVISAPVKSAEINSAGSASVIIDNKPTIAGTAVTTIQGKPNVIHGKVLDETGQPLIGANVHLKDNKYIGTVTDMDGNFYLKTPTEKVGSLEVGYIGYQSKTIPVISDSAIVQLEPSSLALNEVVTTGYAKRSLLQPKANTAINNELSGKVAGISTESTYKKPVFGVTEFRKYVKSQLSDSLCNNAHYKLTATFNIDNTGKPTGTKIVYSNCRSLETEFIRLTNESPQWTNINKKVKVTIKK